MKTKLLTFFVTLVCPSILFASNVITYTATSKLYETTDEVFSGLHTNAFNVTISSHDFSNGTGTITFSGEVTSIGYRALYDCSDLTSITIPNSVTEIGDAAFYGCTRLTSPVYNANCFAYMPTSYTGVYTIPNGITQIAGHAFYGCTGLTSITIPNSVTEIGDAAFYGCTRLTSPVYNANCFAYMPTSYTGVYTIPNGITQIAGHAFNGCTGLTSITIPNSVTSIGSSAFSGCSGLTSITIPNSVTSIGGYAFEDCSGLTSITIPNSVTSIEYGAFSGCSGLTSITIPNSVTSIGEEAFSGCSGIDSVVWNAKNCNSWNFGNQVKSFTFGDSVQGIPANVCQGMSNITSISIPSSVQSIGNNAFQNCTGISELNINNGVTSIGDYAFFGLSDKNLKTINLPNSVETIGKYAFAECSYLKTITLGAKLEDMDEYAFQNDERLLYVNCYAEEPPVLQENAFDNYDIYLQVPCEVLDEYKVAKGWKLFNKANVSCLSAEGKTLTSDQITVTPSANDATFTWPASDQAEAYSLEITKDGVVFCTLKFNAQGQLVGIAFAPGRNGNHHAPSAIMTTNGWQFTVTGLDQASKYAYTLDVTDAGKQVIKSYKGEFATDGYTDLLTLPYEGKDGIGSSKFIQNGQLYILRDGKTYTVQGVEIK